MPSAAKPAAAAVATSLLLYASLALLYVALRARIAAVDASALARLRSWEPQVATALAAAVLARAAAATDAVARLTPGGRLAGAPRMAVACGVTLLATAGGRERVGPAAAAWLLAASAAAALLWSWSDDGGGRGASSGVGRGGSGGGSSAVIETTPAALAQELDAEASRKENEDDDEEEEEKQTKKTKKNNNNKSKESLSPPLIAVLFYDPRGGPRAAAVSAAFDALSEEEDGASAAPAGEKQPLVLYRRLDASRWPEAAAALGASWETASATGSSSSSSSAAEAAAAASPSPPTLPALALFCRGEMVASSPGEGGRLPASVGALRRALKEV